MNSFTFMYLLQGFALQVNFRVTELKTCLLFYLKKKKSTDFQKIKDLGVSSL